jgi:hypothetical protein
MPSAAPESPVQAALVPQYQPVYVSSRIRMPTKGCVASKQGTFDLGYIASRRPTMNY